MYREKDYISQPRRILMPYIGPDTYTTDFETNVISSMP